VRTRCISTITGLGLALGLTFSASAGGTTCADADLDDNGTVNVSDLLNLIGQWGTAGPADFDGSGAVGVSDLLTLIGFWGCVAPVNGACCTGGVCTVTSQTACTNGGGTFQGAGTNCGATNCPPANDECTGAIPLAVGGNNITNVGATDGTVPNLPCANDNGVIRKDVWFTYTNINEYARATFSLCNTTGGVTDTLIGVYAGSCATLGAPIGCDDDGCTGTFLSTASVDLMPNQMVRVRVGSWGNNVPGPMLMNVTSVSNDQCDGAAPVAIDGTIGDSVLGSTTETNLPSCSTQLPGNFGRWYKVTGNGNQLAIDLCDSPDNSNDIYDPRISVFCGSSCNSIDLFCPATLNDDGTCPTGIGYDEVVLHSGAGQEYLILVHTTDAPAALGFVLAVSDTGNASTNVQPCAPPAAPNDECVDVANGGFDVTLGNNNIDTSFGRNSPDIAGNCGASTCDAMFADVWYRFTPPAAGPYVISLCGNTPNQDGMMQLLGGTCASLVHIAGDDDFCGPASFSQISVTLANTNPVFLRVGYWNAAADPPQPTTNQGQPLVLNITQGEPVGKNCTTAGCAITTQAVSNATCGGFWTGGADCTLACPSPTVPATACTGAVAGNGAPNSNGIRPTGGWGGGTLGITEDLFLCSGATLEELRITWLDGIAPASTGTPSSVTQMNVRIYNLNNQSISTLDPNAPPTPVYDAVHTIGTNATRTLGTAFNATIDRELWVYDLPTVVLPAGEYAIWISPVLTGDVGYFVGNQGAGAAPGPANMSTPSVNFAFGTLNGNPVNANFGTHTIFCVNP
jgi:hypothetical protein